MRWGLLIVLSWAAVAAEGEMPPPQPAVVIEAVPEVVEKPMPPAARLLQGLAERLAEQAPLDVVNAQPLPWPQDPKAPKPGREAVAAMTPAAAYRFQWDGYNTLVVVGDGAGVTRPAWVVTMEGATSKLAVSYRATAWNDRVGRVHVDARHAEVSGPMAGAGDSRWWPDSFCVAHGWVYTIDDTTEDKPDRPHPGHTSALAQVILPTANPAEYRRLLSWAQGVVEGGL